MFSKEGPNLISPALTNNPNVIPKIYKLKNNISKGNPNFKIETPPSLIAERDSDGNIVVDPNDSNKYKLKYVDNISGTVLPSIGLQFEF